MRVFQLVKNRNNDRDIDFLVLRKTNRRQRQDGANWRGYSVFARRACRYLTVSSRLPTPGNLYDLSGFDFIIDLFDLRMLLAPFASRRQQSFQGVRTRPVLFCGPILLLASRRDWPVATDEKFAACGQRRRCHRGGAKVVWYCAAVCATGPSIPRCTSRLLRDLRSFGEADRSSPRSAGAIARFRWCSAR